MASSLKDPTPDETISAPSIGRIDAALKHAAGDLINLATAGFAADFAALQTMEDPDTFAGPPDDQRRIDYLPTPAEIHNACANIRENWTMSEKRRRFVGDYVPDEEERLWQPPVIDTSHFRVSSGRVGTDSGR